MKDKILKNIKNRYIVFTLILIITIVIVYFLFTSRAYLSTYVEGNTQAAISMSSCSSISMDSSSEYITITNAYPVSDNVGMNSTPYEFSINYDCSGSQEITVYLVINSDTTLGSEDINTYYGLVDDVKTVVNLSEYEEVSFSSDYVSQYNDGTGREINSIYVLGSYTVAQGESENLSLGLWIDSESVNSDNGTFNATIVIADSEIVEAS